MTRTKLQIALLAAASLVAAPAVVAAAPKPATPRTVTLSAPYQVVDVAPTCAPEADRSTGRLAYDSFSAVLGGCGFDTVAGTQAYMGSDHGLASATTFTVTLHVDRLHVRLPQDPYLQVDLAAARGFAIATHGEDSRYPWACNLASLLTPSERTSTGPVTVTDRDVRVTCPSAPSLWGGVLLRHSQANLVQLDARLSSIVARS